MGAQSSPDTLRFIAWQSSSVATLGFWYWQADGMREVWGPLDEVFMWAEAKRLAVKLGFERIRIDKLPRPPNWWRMQGMRVKMSDPTRITTPADMAAIRKAITDSNKAAPVTLPKVGGR